MGKSQCCYYCGGLTLLYINVCDTCCYKHPKDSAYRTIQFWQKLNPLLHDHEFTGLSVGAEITESYIATLHGKGLFYSRFNPNIEVEKKAEQITGLNLANLSQEPELHHHWPTLFSLINNRTLISWGSHLDERVLRDAAANFDTPFGPDTVFLDLEPLYSRIRGKWNKGLGQYERTSLVHAAELENIAIKHAHNAQGDVDTLIAIFNKLQKVSADKTLNSNPVKNNFNIDNPFYQLLTTKA